MKFIEVLTILFHNYFAGYFDYWTLNRGGSLNCWPKVQLNLALVLLEPFIIHCRHCGCILEGQSLSVLFPLDQTNMSETTGSNQFKRK